MKFDLDSYFRTHAQALLLHAKRLEVLATNITNADTPGYQARDIDFRAVLTRASQAPQLLTTQPHHIEAADIPRQPRLLYRVPLAPSLDGNTVDVASEQAAFAESTIRYQSALQFVSARTLLLAITGQQS